MIAAPDRPLEAARDLDAEQHLARFEQIVELLDVVNLVGELEVLGVLKCFQDRAAEIGVLLQQHRGRQIVRRGVDGVAEQEKLHHRDHHDHRKRHPVAAKLDELLHHHGVGTPPKPEPGFLRLVAGLACGQCHAHWKLSLERLMSSMKTSSSDGAAFCQCRPGRSRKGAIVASSASWSRPETCREVPNGATMSMPGLPEICSPSACRSSPETVNVVSCDLAITSSTVPCASRWP